MKNLKAIPYFVTLTSLELRHLVGMPLLRTRKDDLNVVVVVLALFAGSFKLSRIFVAENKQQ